MNIDKDIERCKELIKAEHSNWIGMSNQDAISNVLTQLNTNKYDINIYEERITSLKSELETWKKIAKLLAKKILSIHHPMFNMITVNNIDELIECARKEVENGNK